MAKPLVLTFRGQSVDFSLEKVDRSKLYGYTESEVVDDAGKKCELVTLAGDGQTLISKGGTAMSYFSPDGMWRKKTELIPIDLEGNTITPVQSTFNAPVTLETPATIDDFLSHNIHSVYQLSTETPSVELVESLADGKIYKFPFSYRGGLEASVAFVLLGSDGNVFMLVGSPTTIEFVGLNQPAPAVVEEETAETEEEDLLDFSLV